MTDYAIIYTLAGMTFLFSLAFAWHELTSVRKARNTGNSQQS